MHVRNFSIAAVSLLAAVACTPGTTSAGKECVVSVSKQINEYMFDIGAEGVIVGRDLTSIYPDRIRSIPSVGYHRALSAEGITSLQPTLFLTDGNVGPATVLDQLRKVGIPILTLQPGSTIDSAQALMLELGRRFHHEKAADSVVAEWKYGMQQVAGDTAAGPRVRVLVMHFGQLNNNYLAVSRGSPADEIIRMAGGANAIDSVGRMTRLNPELIARTAPDVIIATDVGFDRAGSAEKFAALPGVALTPAGKSKRIYRIDESEVMYYGPRTPATIRKLRGMLHTSEAAAAAK